MPRRFSGLNNALPSHVAGSTNKPAPPASSTMGPMRPLRLKTTYPFSRCSELLTGIGFHPPNGASLAWTAGLINMTDAHPVATPSPNRATSSSTIVRSGSAVPSSRPSRISAAVIPSGTCKVTIPHFGEGVCSCHTSLRSRGATRRICHPLALGRTDKAAAVAGLVARLRSFRSARSSLSQPIVKPRADRQERVRRYA